MTTTKLLTAEEVAERLHMSVWSVHRDLQSGRLRGSKPKKRWLVSESAIQDYLTAHSNEAPEDKPQRRRRRRW